MKLVDSSVISKLVEFMFNLLNVVVTKHFFAFSYETFKFISSTLFIYMKIIHMISIVSLCSQFQPDVEPGDVVIVLQQLDHNVFTREGNNLLMTKTIPLTEALCGLQFVVHHLDGRDLVVSSQLGEVIKPGWCRLLSCMLAARLPYAAHALC